VRGFVGIEFGQEVPVPRIERVAASSPAEAAGLRPGDVIRSIDGEDVTYVWDVMARLMHAWAGDALDIVVDRDGKRHAVHVVLAPRPPPPVAVVAPAAAPDVGTPPEGTVPTAPAPAEPPSATSPPSDAPPAEPPPEPSPALPEPSPPAPDAAPPRAGEAPPAPSDSR
jgi:membrane-associated protease RseP (regulator of RpoE activity)